MNDFHLYDLFNIITLINHFKYRPVAVVGFSLVTRLFHLDVVMCLKE